VSFAATQRVPLGFALEGRVAADLSLAPDRYLRPVVEGEFRIDPQMKLNFVDAVVERVRSVPGVRAASAAFTSPLSGAPNRGITIEGAPLKPAGSQDSADFQLVTPDFFRAIGVPVVRGRALLVTDRRDTAPVMVVNQSFANRYFPGQDPIGRRVGFGPTAKHEVVGVVGDMRYRNVEAPADPTFYVPISQNAERWPFMSFVVWSDAAPVDTVAALREAIRGADANQAITRVRSFEEIVGTALSARRFNTLLVTLFAGAALLLAAVGTYGVMAYAVAARTRELGVRAALGASPRQLVHLVLSQGLRVTVAAVGIGVVSGLALTGLMRSMLYDVAPRDPATFAGVAVLLTIVALTATWLPARRATGVSPIRALREE
jgi:putative ABC transport system permease protein